MDGSTGIERWTCRVGMAEVDQVVVADDDAERMLACVRAIRQQGFSKWLVVVSRDWRVLVAAANSEVGVDECVCIPDAAEQGAERHSMGVASAACVPHLDFDRRVVEINAQQFRLKKTGFALVSHLVQRAGTWVSSGELRDEVLRTHFAAGASNIRWHMLEARRALGAAAGCLHSCRRGYMFALAACGTAHCRLREAIGPTDFITDV
ncbi:MAG TPA: hypothetical protein VK524_16995 [Polyangiaceae bacterium]|nr:hypothetical protein [Polyangiaceae bacterium]